MLKIVVNLLAVILAVRGFATSDIAVPQPDIDPVKELCEPEKIYRYAADLYDDLSAQCLDLTEITTEKLNCKIADACSIEDASEYFCNAERETLAQEITRYATLCKYLEQIFDDEGF